MAATFIFLSVLRTNNPSCIDWAVAALISAREAEMREWRELSGRGGGREREESGRAERKIQ